MEFLECRFLKIRAFFVKYLSKQDRFSKLGFTYQGLAHYQLLDSPPKKNCSYIFKLLESIKRRTVFHETWKECEVQVSVSRKFYWKTYMVICLFCMTAFALQGWTWVIITKTLLSTKPKIFLPNSSQKKFANLCYKREYVHPLSKKQAIHHLTFLLHVGMLSTVPVVNVPRNCSSCLLEREVHHW